MLYCGCSAAVLVVVRDATCGHCGGLYTLRCPLHCAAKILYELCLVGFHRRTKPSKLAIHGSISPCLGVHASAFLCIMRIIRQYLSSFVIRGHLSVYSPPQCPQAASRTLRCNTLWRKYINKYKKRFMNLNHCWSHCYV